jgi:soluble lytic murein transglycosylase-like protein
VNTITYALQLSPDDSVNTHQSISNKFKLSRPLLQGGELAETPYLSKHLSLFDPQVKSTEILSAKVKDVMQATRIRNVVSSGDYLDEIFSVAKEYNIDPLLLHAIAEVESRYNPIAISSAGAKGLMQVMPATARRFGMLNPDTELLDPRSNLRVSSNYLRSLYSLFGNNLTLILAAYNAGENAVIKYGYAIPPYHETQQYVKRVMNRYLELKDRSMQF